MVKRLDLNIIDEGAKLLDVGTFSEFEAFAVKNLQDEVARKNLVEKLRMLVRSENRGKAIALWREVARDWTDLEPGELHTTAREMLRAGGVTTLTKDELRRAEVCYAALMAAQFGKTADVAGMLTGAELIFAIAVATAKTFENCAKELGVRLP